MAQSTSKQANGKSGWFNRFATKVALFCGRPSTFVAAVALVAVWAFTGPFMGYSEVWQLTINTGTTVITFLMVFIIQSTQNRDNAALQIKLDELIRTTQAAHNSLLNLEELSEDELEELRRRYIALAKDAKDDGIELVEVLKPSATR